MALRHSDWLAYGSSMGRYMPSAEEQRKEATRAQMRARNEKFGAQVRAAHGLPPRETADRDFGSTMPTRADLANALQEGQFFTVGGQRFKWTGTDAVPVDAEGNAGGDALAGQFEEAEAELHSGYEDLESEAKGLLEGRGAGSEARIRRDWGEFGTKAATGAHQWAMTHGLASTTVAPSLQKGAAETTQRNIDIELGQLEEGLRREELGVLTGVRGAKLGMQERRTPDYRFQADLAAQQGEWSRSGAGGIYGAMSSGTGGGGYGRGTAGQLYGPVEGVDSSTMSATAMGQPAGRRSMYPPAGYTPRSAAAPGKRGINDKLRSLYRQEVSSGRGARFAVAARPYNPN